MASKVPEYDVFISPIVRTVANNGLVLPPRPNRISLLLSGALFAGTQIYSLGPSPSTGIVITVPLFIGHMKLCYSELGDVIGQALWNIAGLGSNLAVTEAWAIPTGRCVCPEEI